MLLCSGAFSKSLQTQALPLRSHWKCTSLREMALIKCASSRWQGNLFEDISHLREEGHCADVRLVGGAGRSVSLAHSLVLASFRWFLSKCFWYLHWTSSPCLREALLSMPPSETELLVIVPDASHDEVKSMKNIVNTSDNIIVLRWSQHWRRSITASLDLWPGAFSVTRNFLGKWKTVHLTSPA